VCIHAYRGANRALRRNSPTQARHGAQKQKRKKIQGTIQEAKLNPKKTGTRALEKISSAHNTIHQPSRRKQIATKS
jgi:hypothetical protein